MKRINPRFLLVFAACGMLCAAHVDARTIYGYQVWQPGTPTPHRGPVKLDAADPSRVTFLTDASSEGVAYSGYYRDYHWIGQVVKPGTQSSVDGLYDFDLVTGKRTRIATGGTKLIDITYDYATNTVWGIRNGNTILAKLDPTTGQNTAVAVLKDSFGSEVYMLAIAAALDGTLYGVSSSDCLFTINPATGACSLVGALTVDAAFDQTMAFDYADGTLYWVNNADYSLYTINTTTGKATLVGVVGGADAPASMGSLFIPYINVAKGAPDRVTDASARGTANAAILSWTNPAITAQGDNLTDLAGVKIRRNGQDVATVTLSASDIGKTSTYTDNGGEPGKDYEYQLVPFNAAGEGGVDITALRVHIGADKPGAPVGLKATQGDGSAILTWQPPVQGAAGGVFDAADITGYVVKRGTKTLATLGADVLSYEDKTSYGTYTYSVAAISAAGTGAAATVADVVVKPALWIIMGDGKQTVEPDKTYKFYDHAGPHADYANSRNQTLTIAPAQEGYAVTADFTEFSLDTYGDWLSVYQGTGTAGELIGKFASTAVPAGLRHIESTAKDGALTFVFHSDVMEVSSGWAADVKAVKRLANDLEASSLAVNGTVVAGTECVYTVTVANKGSEAVSQYGVQLLADGNVVAEAAGASLEAGQSAKVEIKHTPAVQGDYSMQARVVYAPDQNTVNNTTAAVAQRVLPQGSAVVDLFSANPAKLYIMPISFMAKESISQILLLEKELEAAKGMYLTAVSFPLETAETSYAAVPMVIWAGETQLANLVDNIVPSTQMTKVFDGGLDIKAGDAAMEFTFTQPCKYSGGNLAMTVYKRWSATDTQGVNARGDYGYGGGLENRTRFDYNNEEGQSLNPDAVFGYAAQSQRPDMRLTFSRTGAGVDDVTVDTGAGFVLNGRTLTVSQDTRVYSTAGVLSATLQAGQSAALLPGVYVLRTANGAAKLAVK